MAMKRSIKPLLITLLVLALLGGGWWAVNGWQQRRATPRPALPNRMQLELEREVQQLRDEIRRLDETLWAPEVLAQRHGDTVVQLWDRLRAATDKAEVLRSFPFEQFTMGRPVSTNVHPHEVRVVHFAGEAAGLTGDAFRSRLGAWVEAGYELVQSEWHHERFTPPADGPARSVFAMELHVTNRLHAQRLIVTGELEIEWSSRTNAHGQFEAQSLALPRFTVASRAGPPAFVELTGPARDGPPFPFGNEPVLAYDLDRDGLSELLLPEQNVLWWNRGDGRYEKRPLCAKPAVNLAKHDKQIWAAVVADMNADGHPDLVVAGREPGVVVFHGVGGTMGFPVEGAVILEPTYALVWPQVITAGDINGDGRLDLWVGQLKVAGDLGSMPTPYWDANDGFRSYLLVNNGDGTYAKSADHLGLRERRYRRTYGSSFVDVDDDGDLDLLISADYAGVDLHLNDGRGNFTDVTASAFDQRHLFGMGHAFADFNRDGRMDVYVTGMDPATARRLDAMGLERPEFPDHTKMRSVMAYGSRLYHGTGSGRFAQPAAKDSVARSGWSWGVTAFDFANDGFADLYVANGHISRHTAKSYATRSWTHEIYLGDSRPNLALERILDDPTLPHLSQMSYEGFQHNKLYLNDAGAGFLNVGFLFDTAFEYDARCVLADDLDADGRVDLVVSELFYGRSRRGEAGRLHLYRNAWPSANHWIGVRLHDEPGVSPIGARITVHTANGPLIARIVTGDSYSAQHAPTKHFGLGSLDRVDALEVRWQNGTVKTLRQPAIGRYHTLSARAE
jgi:enediyne biosynthesis protein E4